MAAVAVGGSAVIAGRRQNARWQVIASYLAIGIALLTAVHSTRPHDLARDFATLDAGAACLREGCSPYDTHALDRMAMERGHGPLSRWDEQLPIYPPTTLALMLPFSFLSMRAASVCMWALSLGAILLASYLCFVRGSLLQGLPLLVRVLLIVVPLTLGQARLPLILGNPVALALPLVLFCCFDAAPSRRTLRAVLFCIALLLKPTIALPFALPLLLKTSDGPRTVIRSLLYVAAFAAVVAAWCATQPTLAHWPADLHRELALGASTGHSMDPGGRDLAGDHLLNLQYLFGYWTDRAPLRDTLTYAAVLLLAGALLAGCRRAYLEQGDAALPLVVAATSAFALLPVYHRSYDSVLLLLVLPWALLAWQQRRHRLAAVFAIAVYALDMLGSKLKRLYFLHTATQAVPQHAFTGFLQYRLDSFAIACLAVLLIGLLFVAYREPQVNTSL